MALILIKKLGTRLGSTGRKESWGEFLCFNFGCFKIVERALGSDKKVKSCGCITIKLISESSKNRIYTKERNRKISESKKGKKREPFTEQHIKNIIKSQIGRKHSDKTKQIMKEKHKGKIISEETIKKQIKTIKEQYKNGRVPWNKGLTKFDDNRIVSGEKCGAWQNGKSFEIYPQEFKQIKKFIYERDNYQCQYPNCVERHGRLHAHHIDYDKKNNNPENLITLGTSCHSKTIGKNRNYWTVFYQNIMINKLMECLL